MHRPGGVRPGFRLVFRREIGWLRRRPFLFVSATLLPLCLMAILTGVFSAGLATGLPVGVLDLDGSDLSRAVTRLVDASPEADVAAGIGDLAEGRSLLVSGRIYGLLLLPRDLERDVLAGRRPEVVFFYNTQMLTTGNLVLRGVSGAATGAAAGIRLSLRTAAGEPMDDAVAALAPVPVQTHALFNPTLNYVHFLLAALLPSLLQIAVVTTTAYSAGLDIETRHRLAVLRRLGGGLWPALLAKLLPFTILYLAVLGLSDAVLFGALDLPLRGSGLLLLAAGLLFIIANQLLGVLLALVLRPMTTAISIAMLLTAPAFGFMGIGFPRIGMNGFAWWWGEMLPGTWYLTARIDQTIRGTPLDASWQPVLMLAAFVTGLALLVAGRLELLRRWRLRPPAAVVPAAASA